MRGLGPFRSRYPRPASLARMIAWARSATYSLVKMLETWLPTVFVLRESSLAMEGLGWPWAMKSRISHSRSVRLGKAWGGGL